MLNSPSAHPFASLLLPFLKLRSAAIARKMVGVSPAEYAELWARLEELGELALLLSPPEFPGDDVRYVSFERRRREVVTEFPALVEVPAVDAEGTKTIGAVKVEYRWNPGRWFAVATIPIGVELREILKLEHGEFFQNATKLRTLEKDGETKEAAIGKALEELGEWIGGPIVDVVEVIGAHEVAWVEGYAGALLLNNVQVLEGAPSIEEGLEPDRRLASRKVEEWNALYPVGTKVRYRNPTARPGAEAPTSIATTRTPAEVLQFYPVSPGKTGKAVVWVSDCSIPIPLEDVEVVETWGKCPLSAPGGCRRVACWESGKCQAGNVAVGGGAQ